MKVGVIGSGTMGAGIAQVAATSGWKVALHDSSQEALRNAESQLEKILARLVEKGKLDQSESDGIRSRISYEPSMQGFPESDLIIEAVVEHFDVKSDIFTQVEDLVSSDCIVATNTSSLSVTSLASTLEHPERFVGIHFFNPAPLMKLVEIIPALQTSPETTQKAEGIIGEWGKKTVLAMDTPGFIVNKVARPFYSEALRILDEGIADYATIDWAVKEFGGFRMGPFELMDFIGNDVNFQVTETVFKAFYQDPRYRPSFTQKRLFEAGYLGRKSGRGYYHYGADAQNPEPEKDRNLGEKVFQRILVMLINEAADTVHFGIASKEDVDMAMTYGVNYPMGLLKWADELGAEKCVGLMDDLFHIYHEERYRCSPLLRKMADQKSTFFEIATHG